jgi:hypothetical protein
MYIFICILAMFKYLLQKKIWSLAAAVRIPTFDTVLSYSCIGHPMKEWEVAVVGWPMQLCKTHKLNYFDVPIGQPTENGKWK